MMGYELLLVYFCEGSIHVKGSRSCDFCWGELFLEFFLNFIEEDNCCFNFEGAICETDIEDVAVLDDVVVISVWREDYSSLYL
jgi:hypothetical protein